uniref:(northern house mosquito) hypothetical protein n=1 Tax=Culex pipiens TaxID=7175 RepID=A0A8D8FT01_CULPI
MVAVANRRLPTVAVPRPWQRRPPRRHRLPARAASGETRRETSAFRRNINDTTTITTIIIIRSSSSRPRHPGIDHDPRAVPVPEARADPAAAATFADWWPRRLPAPRIQRRRRWYRCVSSALGVASSALRFRRIAAGPS